MELDEVDECFLRPILALTLEANLLSALKSKTASSYFIIDHNIRRLPVKTSARKPRRIHETKLVAPSQIPSNLCLFDLNLNRRLRAIASQQRKYRRPRARSQWSCGGRRNHHRYQPTDRSRKVSDHK